MKSTDLVKITLKNIERTEEVLKWEAAVNKIINHELRKERVGEKIVESLALGVPLLITKKGKVKVIRRFYINFI